MLQTNTTGVCSQCHGHTGFAPAHGLCAFPVYIVQALCCSAENCLRRALGCMHFPGLSLSGSFTWVLLKSADSVGPVFCALPRSEPLRWPWPGVWRARSLLLIASPVPAAQFSACTTGLPSQEDIHHPESQEDLVRNEACLQYSHLENPRDRQAWWAAI